MYSKYVDIHIRVLGTYLLRESKKKGGGGGLVPTFDIMI